MRSRVAARDTSQRGSLVLSCPPGPGSSDRAGSPLCGPDRSWGPRDLHPAASIPFRGVGTTLERCQVGAGNIPLEVWPVECSERRPTSSCRENLGRGLFHRPVTFSKRSARCVVSEESLHLCAPHPHRKTESAPPRLGGAMSKNILEPEGQAGAQAYSGWLVFPCLAPPESGKARRLGPDAIKHLSFQSGSRGIASRRHNGGSRGPCPHGPQETAGAPWAQTHDWVNTAPWRRAQVTDPLAGGSTATVIPAAAETDIFIWPFVYSLFCSNNR